MIKKILFILVILLFLNFWLNRNKQMDNRFYEYQDVFPFLHILKDNKLKIKNEVLKITKDQWKVWPETYLYENKLGWKVFPFYGFGFWIERNCNKYPVISSILKKIPGLRTASLSRLTPGTKLLPHHGWAKLSNYVLRCQYGIIVKGGCILGCENEIVEMKEDKIVVFDDSKLHFAENNGKYDRIVLILDIDRPSFVKTGISDVEDTSELTQFINYMKDY